jgi:hypothetical protein
MDEILENIYFNSSHPASYGGVKKLYKYAKMQDQNITLNYVKSWLSKKFEYTLYKPAIKNFERNLIYVSFINECWEMDSLHYVNFARYNNGYKYIINIVDQFSKYLIAIITKSLKMKELIPKFKILFSRSKPMKIRTDRGSEFNNKEFRALCQKYNIIYYTTTNQTKKCAIVERVNYEIRKRIRRYVDHTGNYRYIDKLKDVIGFYNLYGYPNMLEILKSKQKNKIFEIGDEVRLKFDEKPLHKGSNQKWSDIVYKVMKVYNKLRKPQYSVEYNGNILNRRFYPEELQKVKTNPNSDWRIEKILRYRTNKITNIREALVRWKGFSPEDDQWIPLEAIRDH